MSSEPKNGKEPEVSRFSLDGIVAEMVVEVDEENDGVTSPSKIFKLNGLDEFDKMSDSNLKKCSVDLDTKMSVDDTENAGSDEENKKDLPQEKEITSDEQEKEIKGDESNEPESSKEAEKDELVQDKAEESDDVKGDESDEKSKEELEETNSENLENSATAQDKTELDEEKKLSDEEKEEGMDVEEEKMEPVESNEDENVDEPSKVLKSRTKVVQSREVRKPVKPVKRLINTDSSRRLALRSQLKAKVEETAKSKKKILKTPIKNEKNKSAPERVNKKAKPEETVKPDEKVPLPATKKDKNESTPEVGPKKRGRKRKIVETSPEVVIIEEKKLKTDSGGSKTRLSTVNKTEEGTKNTMRNQAINSITIGKRTRSGILPASVPEKSKQTVLKKSTQPKSTVPVESPKKPKTYSLNRSGDTRLGGFPNIKEKIETVKIKSLRNLYPLLFDRNLPNIKTEKIRRRILSFQGFDFKKSSTELISRQRFLKTKTPSEIAEICEILDIKVGSKPDMISDIIKFLLKPAQILVSLVDPFHSSMQPVVNLERMNLGRNYLQPTETEEAPKSADPASSAKIEKKQGSEDAAKVAPAKTAKVAPKKTTELETKAKNPKISNVKGKIAIKGPTQSLLARKKLVKLAIQGRKPKATFLPPAIEDNDKSPADTPIAEESEEQMPLPGEIQIKSEPIIESYYEVNDNMEGNEMEENDGSVEKSEPCEEDVSAETSENLDRNEDSSSDSTLSSDEMKEQSNKGSGGDLWVKRGKTSILGKVDSSTKRIVQRRYGKPLSSFPKIKENIINADYKALLRVHILLFGASDKAEKNVRGNILAFGGFPFLEGSEEWKQKEFLLSLLAHNNLQEYMTLLCIHHSEDDDVTSMIKKLMKFLAAPNDENEKTPEIEESSKTQVVSSEPVSTAPAPVPQKVKAKKKSTLKKATETPVKKSETSAKKADTKKKPAKPRKVLMDEEQVRRLEADLAREQRILERERKLQEEETKKRSPYTRPTAIEDKSIKKATKVAMAANQSDNELLVALLQTVYKRRALKRAGATVSIPNKGGKVRLGELANVQFLVLTANYNDLDVLHHLIYMTKANKARVRKNILEFAGFNFSEDCAAYNDRLNFLESLGYDISRRIAFLLGLCPFKTPIDKKDLNELIMYFLMAPCQSKQIPIKVYPEDMFNQEAMPHELDVLVKKHGTPSDEESSPKKPSTSAQGMSVVRKLPQKTVAGKAAAVTPKRAPVAPGRKVIATPSRQSFSTPPKQSAVTLPQRAKKSFKSSLPSILKKPSIAPKVTPSLLSTPSPKTISLPGISAISTPISNQPAPQPGLVRIPFKTGTIALPPTSPSQELYIQQEAPDGTKKTYKLVKLPAPPIVNQALRIQAGTQIITTPKAQPQPIAVNAPILHAPLPPGLIIFKNNNPTLGTHPLPKVVQTAPLVVNQPEPPIAIPMASSDVDKSRGEVVDPDDPLPISSVECSYEDEEMEELNPLDETNPPSDHDLFMTIQEIVLDADFDDITLQNVIDRIYAHYSAFDLTNRRPYIKECIRKVILGT